MCGGSARRYSALPPAAESPNRLVFGRWLRHLGHSVGDTLEAKHRIAAQIAKIKPYKVV
jgi:hypothetical protein